MHVSNISPALGQLQWLTLRFHLQLQAPLTLPPVPGVLVRSVLGMALQQTAPELFQTLFGNGDELGRQYAVYAPIVLDDPIQVGDTWSFDISLFNRQVEHVGALIGAILHLQQAGLGKQRAPFKLAAFGVLDVDGNECRDMVGFQPLTFAALDTPPSAGAVSLNLQSPLRLKQGGNILHQPPDMALLLQRLIGRVSGLLGQPDELLAPDYYTQLQRAAEACQLEAAEIDWLDAERYSARQRQAMVLGGLIGRLDFTPPAAMLWPWLRLMQHLQLGNKTTFGFGKIGIVGRT